MFAQPLVVVRTTFGFAHLEFVYLPCQIFK